MRASRADGCVPANPVHNAGMHHLRAVALVTLTSLLAPIAAIADQTDARLDDLFTRLQAVEDESTAAELTRRIWTLWRASDNALVETAMERGARALAANRLVRAERWFDQVVEMAPEYAEGWNQRATVRYLRGNYAQSAADIRRTLMLEPRHFGALSGLGLVYMELGQDAAALDAFRRALRLNPHLSGVRENIERLEKRRRQGDARLRGNERRAGDVRLQREAGLTGED